MLPAAGASAASRSPRCATVRVARSAGSTLLARGRPHREDADDRRRRSRDSTSRCSPRAGPRRGRSGRHGSPPGAGVVIDNSSAWRMDADVPLVVSEVNPRRRCASPARASSPTPTARPCQMVVALKPLHDEAGIERVVDRAPTRPSPVRAGGRWTSFSTSPTRCCTSGTSTRPSNTPTRSPSMRCRTRAASPRVRTTPTRSSS